ncbi:MAG: DnaJ domain-containing protein [Thermoplasmatota archaeon]
MRYPALAALLLILVVPFLLTFTGPADASMDDSITVDLSLHFSENDRGQATFTMGNIDSGLQEVDEVPARIYPYKNDNMERLLRSFRSEGVDNSSLFRRILDCRGALELQDTAFSARIERNYFSIRMECDFGYRTDGIDAEYIYLDVVKDVDDYIKREKGESLIDFNIRRVGELGKIDVKLKVDLDHGLSMSTLPHLSGHKRGPSGEAISQTMGASRVISGTNELKVFDHFLLSPGFALFSLVLYLVCALGLLGFIWYRNRFSGIGLILPIITLLFSMFVILNYMIPSINFHFLGSATIWVWGSVLLGLVIACNYINPKQGFKEYDQEAREQPKLKMPKVVYVDKQVIVERKVRMSEEEAMDPYEVLEVSERATYEEIEEAYRSRIKEYHPDKFDRTPKRIHEAARKETEKLNMAFEKLKRMHGR